MDLGKLKKQVESGEVRTTAEFKRRLLLMFANAVMFNSTGHDVNIYAKEMAHDAMIMLNVSDKQVITTVVLEDLPLPFFQELMSPDSNAMNTVDAAKLRRISSRGGESGVSLYSVLL